MMQRQTNPIFRAGYAVLFAVSLSLLFVTSISLTARAQTPPPTPTPVASLSQDDLPVIATVTFANTIQREYLTSHIDVWHIDHTNQTVTALLSPNQYVKLRQAGYRIKIDEPETQRLQQPDQPLVGQDGGIPGYACYRTVEETFATITQLATDFPNLVSWFDIGDSWEKENGNNGYDIQVVVITNKLMSGPKPKFFLLSTVHARELATAELATRFAEYLVLNYGSDPDITWLLDYFEVHIVPMANPDGRKHAEMGAYWRKNTDNDDGCSNADQWGVDLNRNSTFRWNSCPGCSSGNPCYAVYRGPEPGSEPETQAFEAYVASIYPDQRGPLDTDPAPSDASGVFITLHSYGEWVLFPWGWQTGPSPNHAELETLGRKFGFYTDYETCQAGENFCIYPTDGTNDDWAYGHLGLASYTFEVGTTFFQSCSYFEETIIPENIPALIYAIKASRRPYQDPAGPETLAVTVTPEIVFPGMAVTLTTTADDTRYDSNGWGNEPTQPINAIRYSIDHPSWVTGTTTYPLTAADGQFDSAIEVGQAIINTDFWQPGNYKILVESQDADGNWGVPSATVLSVRVHSEITTTPGNSGTHALDLVNLTNNIDFSDVYDLTIGPHQWQVTAPSIIDPKVTGSIMIPLLITVTPPQTATIGSAETLVLTLTAQSTGKDLLSLSVTTHVSGQLFLPLITKSD
ncbi:MAG: M14 family zinc carboxypeptidase [Chloroflexota bacterium]